MQRKTHINGKILNCAKSVRNQIFMLSDKITKPSVVLPTHDSVISYSLVRRMRLELTRANAHYPLKVACLPFHHLRRWSSH